MENYFQKKKKCTNDDNDIHVKSFVDMDLFPSSSTDEDNKYKREKRKQLKKKILQEKKKIIEIACQDEKYIIYPCKPKQIRTAKVWFKIINKDKTTEELSPSLWNQLLPTQKETYLKKEKEDRERYKKEYYQWKRDVLKIHQNKHKILSKS